MTPRIIARIAAAVLVGIVGIAMLVAVHRPAPATSPTGLAPPLSVAFAPATAPAPAPAAAPSLADFITALRPAAIASGVSALTFDTATRDLKPDLTLKALDQGQLEHTLAAGAYVAKLVSMERVAVGRQKRAELTDLLKSLGARYGVDPDVLLAIWGIESAYGIAPGDYSVIRSLTTLAALDKIRGPFWRGELLAALKILEHGDIALERMTGSWAGAMGHTQFMPSTYLNYAVDFEGHGRRDIWGSVPDALASTANYLKASGWVSGEPWALEVKLPPGFDYALAAAGQNLPLEAWQQIGLTPAREGGWPRFGRNLALVLPAGAEGPAFLTGANFKAILKYNAAVPYVLAVGLLADEIAGRGACVASWPTGDVGLEKPEREELQARLAALGFDPGERDGVLGPTTEKAVRGYQMARAMTPDGHANRALLERVRAEPSSADASK